MRQFRQTVRKTVVHQCFVLMPFSKKLDRVYFEVVKPEAESVGLVCSRVDEILKGSIIMDDVWEFVQASGIIVADLTGKNANVFYELRLAHGIGKDVILLTQNLQDVPFDLRHWRIIQYKDSVAGRVELAQKLNAFLRASNELFELRRKDSYYSPREDPEYFKCLSYEARLIFAQRRGRILKLKERYVLKPVLPGPFLKSFTFVKGSRIGNIKSSIGTIFRRTRGEEREEIHVFLSPKELKQDPLVLELNVTTFDGYPLKREYWTKHLAVYIPKLSYEFRFDKECAVGQFKVVHKKSFDDKGMVLQHLADLNKRASQQVFVWQGSIPKDEYLRFDWLWKD